MPSLHVASRFDTLGDTWEFTSAVAAPDKDFVTRGTDWNTAVVDNLLPMIGADTQFLGSSWGDPYERTAPGQFVTDPAGDFGGRGAPSLPPSAPITVTLYTDQRGRGKQGRWFMGGVCVTDFAGGKLIPASLGDWQTAINDFLAAVIAANLQPLVARINRTTHPPTLISTSIPTQLTVQPIIRVQKRREFGRSIRKHTHH